MEPLFLQNFLSIRMYGNPTWGAQEGFYVCVSGGEGDSLVMTVLGFHSAKLQLK